METLSLLLNDETKVNSWAAIGYVYLGELFASADRKEEALEKLKKAESPYLEMKVTHPKATGL